MKRFEFKQVIVESSLPPRDTKMLWLDKDENTGKIKSIKEFNGSDWELVLAQGDETIYTDIIFENLQWFDAVLMYEDVICEIPQSVSTTTLEVPQNKPFYIKFLFNDAGYDVTGYKGNSFISFFERDNVEEVIEYKELVGTYFKSCTVKIELKDSGCTKIKLDSWSD